MASIIIPADVWWGIRQSVSMYKQPHFICGWSQRWTGLHDAKRQLQLASDTQPQATRASHYSWTRVTINISHCNYQNIYCTQYNNTTYSTTDWWLELYNGDAEIKSEEAVVVRIGIQQQKITNRATTALQVHKPMPYLWREQLLSRIQIHQICMQVPTR